MNRAERRRQARQRAKDTRGRMEVATGDNVVVAGLGYHYDATQPGTELPEKQAGVHRWVAIATYSVPDPWGYDQDGPHMLGLDALVYVGLGCYDCEVPWSDDVGHVCPAGGAP